MSNFSFFGICYGAATNDQEALALRVQEAFNKNGRSVAIRTYIPASDGSPKRYLSNFAIRPELLGGLIAALQKAQRHCDELKKAELAALAATAANDEVA